MLFRLPFTLRFPEDTDKSASLGAAIDKAYADTPTGDAAGDTGDTDKGDDADADKGGDAGDKGGDTEETDDTKNAELEAAQAMELYNSLRDPEKAPVIIDYLAKQAGYTKAEVKAATKTGDGKDEIVSDIQEILRESLGADLVGVADRLAVAIGKILDKKIPEATKDLRDKETQREAKIHEDASAAEITKISNEYFEGKGIPKDIEDAISDAMDDMPPSKGISADKYIRRIFNSVAGERGLTKKNPDQQQVRNRNRNDAAAHLNTQRGASGHVPDKNETAGNKKSLNQIVDDAFKTVAESTN